MSSINDEHYNEIIQLLMEFRKMDDDSIALGFLQSTIKNKIRDYTRGVITLDDLKDEEKCIILPINGFDCCRNDGMDHKENGYRILEKYTDEKKQPRARDVTTKATSQFVCGSTQVIKVI